MVYQAIILCTLYEPCSSGTKGHCKINNDATVPTTGKYDLSKMVYVLVLHHYIFQDAAKNREGSQKDMEKITSFFRNYRVDWLNVNENKTAAEVRIIMDRSA